MCEYVLYLQLEIKIYTYLQETQLVWLLL